MAHSEKEEAIIRKYISNPGGRVSVVELPNHMTGALFARCSRSDLDIEDLLIKEFIDEEGNLNTRKADEIAERVVNEYGDESVEELEVVYVSADGVSNLATKKIEDKRLASYIERSSRYVFHNEKNKQGKYKYLREKKIMESRFKDDYIDANEFFFDTYTGLVKPMQDFFKKLKPVEESEYAIKPKDDKKYGLEELSEDSDIKAFKRTYALDIRTKACDIIRCILPASTLTNVRIVGNCRYYKGLLNSLYSDELVEMNELGHEIHKELNKFVPIYVRRASYNKYLAETEINMRNLTKDLLKDLDPIKEDNDVIILENKHEAFFDNIVSQMLYQYSQHPLRQLRKFVKEELEDEVKIRILNTYIGNRSIRQDRPGRALEFGYPFTFDLVGDFGIYRDMHRQRMKTQQRQNLTTRLGMVIPEEISELGHENIDKVIRCFEISESLYEKLLQEYELEAQYVTLFGHKIRWSQGTNLREEMHENELRTIKQGHPNYRRMCQEKHKRLKGFNEALADTLKFVDHNNYYWSRAESEAKQRKKEALLEEKYKK